MNKCNPRSNLLVATLVSGLTLAACEAPKGASDYRESHSIEVTQKSMEVSFMDQDQTQILSGEELAYFESFISKYHYQGGQGPISVLVSDSGVNNELKVSRIKAMRRLLTKAGVNNNLIKVLPFNAGKNAAITLSFAANIAKPPDCGHWGSGSSFNWSNRRHDNFGCSVQRNLGLTIANPQDLKKPNTMGKSDGEKGANTINSYRTPAAGGGATGTAQ
jgi:pilus biogenesis lipoprotein CpaD